MSKLTAKGFLMLGFLAPVVIGLVVIGGYTLITGIDFDHPEEHHLMGNPNAKVKLVEYSDFQCPFCQRAYPTLKQIMQDYGDKVSLEYRHFPLDFHQYAEKAAEASECAAEQGKFWQFHDYAFDHQDSLNFDALKLWARAIGLNESHFDRCLDSGKYAAKVAAEEKEGEGLGITGTPTTFVNGKPITGAADYESFKQAIDNALQS